MKGVAVIGTSMLDLAVVSASELEKNRCNKVKIVQSFGGSMHNVAWNLGVLGTETHFLSKFGRDETAMTLIRDLQEQSVFVYGTAVNRDTPVFINIDEPEDQLLLSSIHPDFLFHSRDMIPVSVLNDCRWGVTDQADPEFLRQLGMKVKEPRWIFSGQVPDMSVLQYFSGLVVNRNEMQSYAGLEPLDQAARGLLRRGLEWVVITLDQDGAVLVTPKAVTAFPAENSGPYPLGCGDALTAGLAAGLEQGCTVEDALRLGLRAAAVIIQQLPALSAELKTLRPELGDTALLSREQNSREFVRKPVNSAVSQEKN